jgi:ribosomal protein L40E
MLDPFARPYEVCSKCGGRLGLRTESAQGGDTRTYQICRKCNHQIPTAEVHILKSDAPMNRTSYNTGNNYEAGLYGKEPKR